MRKVKKNTTYLLNTFQQGNLATNVGARVVERVEKSKVLASLFQLL